MKIESWADFWIATVICLIAAGFGSMLTWHSMYRAIFANAEQEAKLDRKRFDDGYISGFQDGLTAQNRASGKDII